MNNQMVQQILEIFKTQNRFLITAHIYPDGDSLGSMLGLGIFLKKGLGKNVDMVQEGTVPPHYRFLPFQEKIKTKEQIDKKYDVVIICECPDLERTGGVLEKVEKGYQLINIDHHPDNKMYGNINYLDNKAAALGEMIYEIIMQMDKSRLSKEIATCLYTAILTDTGSFMYSNTTGQTMRIAADLLDKGVNAWQISKEVYHTRPLPLTQLMGLMMNTITTVKDGKIAYGYITQDMFRETGCIPGDTEGFIIPVRAVAGSEIAMLFQETNNGSIKISMRSQGKYDVAEMAKKLGGGGHKMAAGAIVEGNLNDIMKTVIERVGSWMES